LGIDETIPCSRKSPSIYGIGVTPNFQMASPLDKKKDKFRNGEKNLEDLFKELEDFKYVVLYPEHTEELGTSQMGITPILFALISSCEPFITEQSQIIMDGRSGKGNRTKKYIELFLSEEYSHFKKENLIFRKKADETTPLVHNVDATVYLLSLIYRGIQSHERSQFDDKRVKFDVDEITHFKNILNKLHKNY
jgi:hypothetical protein